MTARLRGILHGHAEYLRAAAARPVPASALLYLLILGVAVNLAAFWLSARSVNNLRAVTATIESQHHVQVYACRLGNDARARQITLWTHIAAISAAPPHETSAGKRARQAKIAAFLAYVRQTFPPLDCAAIYRIRPP